MFGIEQQLARWSAPLLSALSGGAAPAGFLERWAGAWDRAARLVAGPPVLAGLDPGRFGGWPGLGLLEALVSLLPVSGAATEPVPGPRARPPGLPLRERRRLGVPGVGSARPTGPAAVPGDGPVRGPRRGSPMGPAAGEQASAARASAAPPAAPGPDAPGSPASEGRPVSSALLARLAGAAPKAAASDAPLLRARERSWPGPPGSRRGPVELGVPEAFAAAARLLDEITRAPRLATTGLPGGPALPGQAAAVEAELSRQFAETVADPPAAEEVLRLVLTQAVTSSRAGATTRPELAHAGAPDAGPPPRQHGGPPGGKPAATRWPAAPAPPGAAAGPAAGPAAPPPRARRPVPADAGGLLLRRLVADWPDPVGRAGAAGLTGLPEAAATTQNTFNVTVHMTGGAADDAELAERLTQILAEQARRHGIDIH